MHTNIILILIVIVIITLVMYFGYENSGLNLEKTNVNTDAKCVLITRPALKSQISFLQTKTRHLIPKIIYQTNETDDIPLKMYENIIKLLKVNKDYSYIYFNADERRKFIANNFGFEVLNAYDRLIPGAYKADLFRYCLLYVRGGVYLDSGMVAIKSFERVIEPETTFISAVDQCKHDYCDGKTGLLNGFIGCYPRHPILLLAIKKAVNNIENKNYGECPIDITGPLVLGKAYKEYTGNKIRPISTFTKGKQKEKETRVDNRKIKLLNFTFPRGNISGIIKDGGKHILHTKYPEYKAEMNKYIQQFGEAGNSHDYHNLWNEKKVFR